MDNYIFLLMIAIIIIGAFQIALFFKIWGMTNDVARIKEILEKHCIKEGSVEYPCESNQTNNRTVSTKVNLNIRSIE